MSTLEESDGAVLGFIWHDASKGNAGSVIDGDVDIFPSRALAEIAAVAGDAVTGALDAGELFDVEVNELAWVSPLVAPRRRWRIEQSDGDGVGGDAGSARQLLWKGRSAVRSGCLAWAVGAAQGRLRFWLVGSGVGCAVDARSDRAVRRLPGS